FEEGSDGEIRTVLLELKVIADVGLIGKPNAGKSTLLSRLSRATPEIADYPFTTKYPNLGMVRVGYDHQFVIADIPGLIEGAHAGVGLGHEFLKHVQRTRLFVHLIEPAPMDQTDPIENYHQIRKEISLYDDTMDTRPELVVVSKSELPDAPACAELLSEEIGKEVLLISAVTGDGLGELVKRIVAEFKVYGQETTGDISPIDDETKNVINQGLAWLAKQQNEDGSFGGQGEYSQNVGVTALAGMAFLCDGNVPNAGQYSKQVTGCLDYLLSRSQVSGYIVETDEQVHGPMYGHGFATMFLAEVYGMSQRKDLREKLARAVDLIIATQNDQGGWRYNPVPEDADISVTVCQMMALRAARNAGISVPKEVIDRAVTYIKGCQNPDGGFRYRLFDAAESKIARSAAALVALYTAGMAEEKVVERGF
ncbi:unnamed protein product, partial [Durusdinium trenchii]